MKNTIKLCLALLVALPLAACSENNAATNAVKDAAASATAAVDKLKGEFGKVFDGDMAGITKSISELQSKAGSLTGEKKTEVDGLMKQITSKKDELTKMFGDMKSMTDTNAFTSMKDKLTNGVGEIKKLIDTAMSKLK